MYVRFAQVALSFCGKRSSHHRKEAVTSSLARGSRYPLRPAIQHLKAIADAFLHIPNHTGCTPYLENRVGVRRDQADIAKTPAAG